MTPPKTPAKPTAPQLRYLRTLALRTGQSFVTPKTAREASQQIDQLKTAKAARPGHERDWELLTARSDHDHITRELHEAPRDATRFGDDELAGHGSSARYADPWDGHHTTED